MINDIDLQLRWTSIIMIVVFTLIGLPVFAASLSNAQLLDRAAEAVEEKDWLSASEHLFAYIQRDPELMEVNSEHASAVRQALANAEANARASTGPGVGGKFDRGSGGSVTYRSVHVPRPGSAKVSSKSLKRLRQFVGRFSGRNDGRRARLTISMASSNRPILDITLRDLDRGVTFRGQHRASPAAPKFAHILRDVRLPRVGGGEGKVFKYLLQHTWNSDYITGVTLWGGREFGANFERE